VIKVNHLIKMAFTEETLRKMLETCQTKIQGYSRELQSVKMQLIAKEREAKLDGYTLSELKETSATTYKAVGKAFVHARMATNHQSFIQVDAKLLENEVQEDIEQIEKDKKDLEKKKVWLDRQISDVQNLLRDALRQK